MALKLHTVICSTRPGRIGPAVARWFHGQAGKHGKFEARLVDLAEFELPVFDEPNHPRMQKYTHEHTRRWAASVASADAFVFVTPEYNYGPPPSLVNALNYLVLEWNYKPAAFVGYGGVSGGLRAVQQAKPTLTTLKMMCIPEAVAIPGVFAHLDATKESFASNDLIDASVGPVLDELYRWSNALSGLRRPA